MQLKQPEDKSRRREAPIPRTSRKEFGHVEEGEGNIWAVSYADLLMVLMSFFVVFFSFSDSKDIKDPDGLLKLAVGFTQKIQDIDTGANPAKKHVAEKAPLVPAKVTPADYVNVDALKKMGASVVISGRSLFIQLPDDIFGKRQYALDETTRAKLDDLYKVLQAQREQLEVVVIGHSDSSHVTNTNNPYLSNNFDLSSLRALRALQYMISLGFPQANISAQGAADGMRNSRSLSIRIQMKETST